MHPRLFARFAVCLALCVGGLSAGVAAAQDAAPPAGYGAADLGTLGGNNSWSTDLTAAGQVVGDAEAADGRWHAVLWSPA